MTAVFCGDDVLAHERNRTRFDPDGLSLDEAYRLAHLPLIAPHDPRVIAAKDGTSYDRGRHPLGLLGRPTTDLYVVGL